MTLIPKQKKALTVMKMIMDQKSTKPQLKKVFRGKATEESLIAEIDLTAECKDK